MSEKIKISVKANVCHYIYSFSLKCGCVVNETSDINPTQKHEMKEILECVLLGHKCSKVPDNAYFSNVKINKEFEGTEFYI